MDFDYIEQGDCLELMKQIPDGSIDMILCDLPYGFVDLASTIRPLRATQHLAVRVTLTTRC